jgi:hypothetical protein
MKRIKIPLMVAVLTLALAGMAFAVDIVNISTLTQNEGVGGGTPGRGDVLIGALYDVRNLIDANLPTPFAASSQGQQTLISIVNTDNTYGVIARLRFREWKRSHECLDIDIPLTSNDVWVAEISRLATGGAVLKSPDRWISNIPADVVFGDFLADRIDLTDFGLGIGGGIPFRGQQIIQFEPTVTLDQALARCEYGYWELIGEERFLTITPATKPPTLQWAIDRLSPNRDVADTLMGTAFLIRPEIAISHQYNANALSDFAVDPFGIYSPPTTPLPNLRDSVQGEAVPGATVPVNPGFGGIDQLEGVLSKRFVLFQYSAGVVDTTPMSTSVVVTFPTKWFHYTNTAPTFLTVGATWPYQPPFTGNCEVQGDCTTGTGGGEIVNVRIWDRDENTFSIPGQRPISPPDVITPGLPRLPYEVNVIGLDPRDPALILFRNNVAIATANSTSGQIFNTGWGFIDLSPRIGFVTSDLRTIGQGEPGLVGPAYNGMDWFNNVFKSYRGLPAIGIVMTEFFNQTVEGYFGNTVPWQYSVAFGELPSRSPTDLIFNDFPPGWFQQTQSLLPL